MTTEQLSREQAISAFNARNATIDINTDAGYQAFLESIRELGSALGQEELYNNFVEQLGNRQEFLRKYPEEAAQSALRIIEEANKFEIALQNQNEGEHITRRGRVQEQTLGEQVGVEGIVPRAIAEGYGAVGWLVGVFQGVAHALGFTEFAESLQDTIDYLNQGGQGQTDNVRRIDERTNRAEAPGYDPQIRSDAAGMVGEADQVAQADALGQDRVAGTEQESTDALRSTRDNGTSVSGATPGAESRTIRIRPTGDQQAAASGQNDNVVANNDNPPVIRIRPTGTAPSLDA